MAVSSKIGILFYSTIPTYYAWWPMQKKNKKKTAIVLAALVALSSPHAIMYLHIWWKCGGIAHFFCRATWQLSEPEKCRQSCLMLTTQLLRGLWLSITCATFPNVHPTSRYFTAHNGFFQALPFVSTATDKGWGEYVASSEYCQY